MKSGTIAKTIFVGSLTMGSLLLSGFSQAPDASRQIEVSVKKFAYTPSDVTVKKGEPVVLILKTEDVAHGLKVQGVGSGLEVR